MWSRISYNQFYLHSALGRPSDTISIEILGKIIKNFSDLNIFPIYVIVIFNLER